MAPSTILCIVTALIMPFRLAAVAVEDRFGEYYKTLHCICYFNDWTLRVVYTTSGRTDGRTAVTSRKLTAVCDHQK